MRSKHLLILLGLFFSCTSDSENAIGDCFVAPNPDQICTEEYNPVCACNDLVYSNSCKAEKAGNLKWKLIKLDSGEKCEYQ